ncbi:DEAD/DEAH box helicase [Listeria ilorinensis]|uniref:DEAD/DEAH box helicase n=1 Tax=Listeria ilorinensis TaxID=2867439 RepID=UPI001EF65C13|nr:DEAD/DEAH box helicase family protein [Listeria ilorinensis]
MNKDFSMYTTNYLNGVMSLRRPQKESIEILKNILKCVYPSKNMDLKKALHQVNELYPTCTDFEREFMSLSFILATGVGKTRLMGAFITYLYTKYGLKNFFVVAPGTTVFNKLRKDLGDPANPKYVFKGIGCFNNPPQIISNEDYKDRNISLLESEVKIFVYNISKFDKENVKIRAVNEYLGDSFFNQLSQMEDLVMIMDEAHHYHGDKGALALNEIKPILGLELTATPYYNKGSKQLQFKNAVYEYPLSESIKDGYTRTPFAVTRKDVNFYNFGDDMLDQIMLQDGVTCHENIKQHLEVFAENNSVKKIKPFMMVVCKDTEHATKIYEYITSKVFRNGSYYNKTLIIHSNQSKAKREGNIQLLLDVESADNPIEIVIHVDMLKEGWDVNNLYTIVPLRTAASKILREQMIGRGLRLPYGERVGETEIDSVMLTAHDKFEELLREAQKGESIFKAGNVIQIEKMEKIEVATTQMNLELIDDEIGNTCNLLKLECSSENTKFIKKTQEFIQDSIVKQLTKPENQKENFITGMIVKEVANSINEDKDLSKVFEANRFPLMEWLQDKTEEYTVKTLEKFIPIPLITITDHGMAEYKFVNFDLDTSEFNHVPIKNELLIQNLENMKSISNIKGGYIDFDGYNPKKILIGQLREKPEIDYEQCSDLLFKLVSQVVSHYEKLYGQNGMQNIIMMNKKDIADKIYNQMMREEHFYHSVGLIDEQIIDLKRRNLATKYNYTYQKNLYEEFEGSIGQTLFTGICKGVFDKAKFDSQPELIFARVIERDGDVNNWLRPNPKEFNLYYDNGKRYEPDFVVETDDAIYLVEVKGEDKLNHPDVLAKKERAINYCRISTSWGKANGYKQWKYLFIPAGQIYSNSSFLNLAARFEHL